MKLGQIINSLLLTDAYKINMNQVIYHQFPSYTTTWTFKCRNKDVFFTPEMIEEIKEQIKAYCNLKFTEEELQYLSSIKWIKKDYVDFLRLWHPRYEDFVITTDYGCGLAIEAEGTWLNSMMYEIPTLAIVNEVYFRMQYNYNDLLKSFKDKMEQKIGWLETGKYHLSAFSEFGTRRRLSGEAQELLIQRLATAKYKSSKFVGTSNLYFAMKYNLTPVGTQGHEYVQCVGQGDPKHNPAYSNWYTLNAWVKEYGVLNGIALTDTIGTDVFLKDFQLTYATLFSGVRHDSGDPYDWGDKMLAHYEKLGVDATQKTLLFSDSLNFKKADELFRYFSGKCKVAFGIGTYLSNDTCVEPLNIVMKVTKVNGMSCAKLSDTPGKGMCKDNDYIDYLKRTIDWRMEHEK